MEQQNDTVKQKSGIFEPKPLKVTDLPVSGPQKAKRISIAIAVILIVILIVRMCSQIYFSPIRKYYRGLSRRDTAVMSEAFPDWLTSANMGDGNMTIPNMCAAVAANTNFICGPDGKVSVSLVSKTAVDAERMEQLTEGIRRSFYANANITKGWSCKLAVTYSPADGSEPLTQTEYVMLYRINGQWRILDVPNTAA